MTKNDIKSSVTFLHVLVRKVFIQLPRLFGAIGGASVPKTRKKVAVISSVCEKSN